MNSQLKNLSYTYLLKNSLSRYLVMLVICPQQQVTMPRVPTNLSFKVLSKLISRPLRVASSLAQ